MERRDVGFAVREPWTPTSGEQDPFQDLRPTLCLTGAVAHLGFLTLFLVTGVQLMAAVNVLCVVWYLACLVVVRRARTSSLVEFGLIAGEVFAHAVLASVWIGWDSGFHFYLLLVVPVTAVSSIRPPWLKTAAVGSAAAAYLGLDLWLRHRAATEALPGGVSEFLYYVNLLSALLILALLAGRYYLLITRAQATLQVMASTDPLTGLPNRKSLHDTIGGALVRARQGRPLSFIMCDVDHFKHINDRGGHHAGDEVLVMLSRCMVTGVRADDVIGRWGGEEFLVVLPDAGSEEAVAVAERLRADIAAMPVDLPGCPPHVTVTIGVATLLPGETTSATIARADAALYAGKRQGRNRVVVATPVHAVATVAGG